MNTKVCLEWTEKSSKKFVTDEMLGRHGFLLDNLEAHIQTEFTEAVNKLSGIVWYGPPNVTDLWQHLDAGYVQVLKALLGVEHRDWLYCKNNADQWFSNEEAYTTKKQRILITQWAGRTWEKLSQPKYGKLRLSKIKLEGLPNYVVPPPTFLEPSEQNIVDCTIPEERYIDIVEEPFQLGRGRGRKKYIRFY